MPKVTSGWLSCARSSRSWSLACGACVFICQRFWVIFILDFLKGADRYECHTWWSSNLFCARFSVTDQSYEKRVWDLPSLSWLGSIMNLNRSDWKTLAFFIVFAVNFIGGQINKGRVVLLRTVEHGTPEHWNIPQQSGTPKDLEKKNKNTWNTSQKTTKSEKSKNNDKCR